MNVCSHVRACSAYPRARSFNSGNLTALAHDLETGADAGRCTEAVESHHFASSRDCGSIDGSRKKRIVGPETYSADERHGLACHAQGSVPQLRLAERAASTSRWSDGAHSEPQSNAQRCKSPVLCPGSPRRRHLRVLPACGIPYEAHAPYHQRQTAHMCV